ncbi:hypothetical protein FJTKL_11270 [Diaporthe vaccinii]|uniref:Uncharacterized protein n=1 Tax=Diaporthe vaccinii TaxID=105482 RepID=A0ABR4EH65_9PEZI
MTKASQQLRPTTSGRTQEDHGLLFLTFLFSSPPPLQHLPHNEQDILGEERHDKPLHQPLAINDITILRPKEMNIRTFETNHRGISDFTIWEATWLPFQSASDTNPGVRLSTASYDGDQPYDQGGVGEERAEGTVKMEKGQQSNVILQRQNWDGNGRGDRRCGVRYKKQSKRTRARSDSNVPLVRDKRGPRRAL